MSILLLILSCFSGPTTITGAVPGVDRPATLEAELRTHLNDPDAKYVNRLAKASSPYLRDHATNPVDWYEWGDEPFERARAENRLVFLSVGYHTCHWCHVMAEESFEDDEIAGVLNTRFVAIKVDREQRPDLDEVYMGAVQMLSGRGGWPLTAILTPEGEPVFAATYLPPRDGDRGSRKGLLTVLNYFAEEWGKDPERLTKAAAAITARLVQAAKPAPPGDLPGPDAIDHGVQALLDRYDPTYGGFGRAPKFPTPLRLDLLLAEAWRRNDPKLRKPVHATLRQMARGGLHDVIGGGFHRYATDTAWRVPHFEKMLYDNAQLLSTYARVAALTDDPELRWVARRTAAFLVDELATPEGTFIAALDADSLTARGHLEEGAFYTFTPSEVRAALPAAKATQALTTFSITKRGNLDGRSVPALVEAPAAPWQDAEVDALRNTLKQARASRPSPARDGQVIVAWNALAISGLIDAARSLGESRWQDAALTAAEALFKGADDEGHRLSRLAAEGSPPAVLEDEANAAVAALDLFGATADPRWLRVAQARLAVIERHFADPAGGWFRPANDSSDLLRRPKPQFEGPEPSGAATAIEAGLRIAHLTGTSTEIADRALRAYALIFTSSPMGMGAVLQQVVRRHDAATEVVVVWPDQADPKPLLDVLTHHDLPHAEMITAPASAMARVKDVPWVEGKVPRDDKPTAYVCTAGVCEFPVTTADGFDQALRRLVP
ncbi:MAG: thioredoxin domain-containing protein [Myxococcota bacterium]